MPVQPKIVVRREIDVIAPVDVRRRAGPAVVDAEKRIGDAQKIGDGLLRTDLRHLR